MLDKPSLLSRFADIVGARHVIAEPTDMERYLVEDRGLYHGRALCVVRPGNVEEVSRLVALCDETGTKIVPQGGNTGLVGGQIPSEKGDEIVLSLTRLTAIRDIDPSSNTMTLEAGVTLLRAQEEAEKIDRLFPLSLASEGSCTIGGNLSTNAGGTAVLAYGNARDLVLGLEVVLADGRILSTLSKLKKDNTGYDLKHLFMGAEGTLGIITAAVLKLFPRPRARETAFIGVASPNDALSLLTLAQERAGPSLVTFEIVPRIGIDFVLRHSPGARDPLSSPHAWYVLLELASQAEHGLTDDAELLLAEALERGIAEDAALATSLDQRNAFWRLREHLSEVQKYEGGSIKHDVSVPVAAVPAFIDSATSAVLAALPEARVVAFGHLGDGNVHFNVSQPVGANKEAFLARWHDINDVVHGIVASYGGSISAEHGIGQLKRELLPEVKDKVALDVMRALKRTLDPKGLLNPGKVL
ncbi:MAG TPA: FAD-binding oxidoreductase [Beijerinckiaceae bacterium]|jgi:FAD/FMN-containing dehydrogenase|nr:FAD-binding oxidoreductase [Beijerinckiaceae bacterium]